jgi:hypothetical protein
VTVRRLPPLVLALVLGVLAAVAVSCGDDDKDRKLLSPTKASEIREELDKIAERVEKGECDELQPAFIRLNRAIDQLPTRTDKRLRRRLASGAENLQRIAPDECRDNRPKTTETTETVPETTETVPPTTTTPPPTTTEPPPTTTEPPPTDTGVPPETTDTGVPPDSGGSEAPETP